MAKEKGPKEPKVKETREQAFVRLANRRVPNALKHLSHVENLGRYPHKAAHTNKIVTALKAAVEKIEYAFGGEHTEEEEEGFSVEA